MKTITVLSVLVLAMGYSASKPSKTISEFEAAERAWTAMEGTPADAKAIARLIEKKKLRVEQAEADGRRVWRVVRTDSPPPGILKPVRKPRPTDAITAPPQTPWVVILEAKSGAILWKGRNRTR